MLNRPSDFAVKYYHNFIKPTKAHKIPSEKEKEALLDLKDTLYSLPTTVIAEEIQTQVFSFGKNMVTTIYMSGLSYIKHYLPKKPVPEWDPINLFGVNNNFLYRKCYKCAL